jgi:hypothetical protein
VIERHAGGQRDHEVRTLGHCGSLVERRAQFCVLGFGVAPAS